MKLEDLRKRFTSKTEPEAPSLAELLSRHVPVDIEFGPCRFCEARVPPGVRLGTVRRNKATGEWECDGGAGSHSWRSPEPGTPCPLCNDPLKPEKNGTELVRMDIDGKQYAGCWRCMRKFQL